MRPIDADKLHLKLLDMKFPIQDQDPILDAMDDCAVDAALVVHGRWIVAHGNPTPYCSQCRQEAIRSFLGGYVYSKHCPHCGAKMDLPEDGEQRAVLKKFRKSKKALMGQEGADND